MNDKKIGFSVSKVKPAYIQVADQLRAFIVEGELKSGMLLPSETKLMEMFVASRSTIREALRLLSSQDLVATSRGASGGTTVGVPGPSQIGAYLERSLGLMTSSQGLALADFLEMRIILEVPAAGLAAKNRTEEQLEKLFSCLRPKGVSDENGHLFKGHGLFHETIIEASGNQLMGVVASPIFSVLRLHFLRDTTEKTFWDVVNCDHHDIAEAIAKQNSKHAEELMSQHLKNLKPTYLKIASNRIKK